VSIPASSGVMSAWDGVLYTVIGVLQPGSRDRQPADLWIPLTLTPEEIANRDFRSLLVTGRLKPGVTIEQANEEMNLIADGHGRLV
jgi:putative ABC transport system permease protein